MLPINYFMQTRSVALLAATTIYNGLHHVWWLFLYIIHVQYTKLLDYDRNQGDEE